MCASIWAWITSFDSGQVQAFAAMLNNLIAVAAVALGYNVWRRETVGRRRAELAEQVLAASLAAIDAIQDARSPSAGRSLDGPVGLFKKRLAFLVAREFSLARLVELRYLARIVLSETVADDIGVIILTWKQLQTALEVLSNPAGYSDQELKRCRKTAIAVMGDAASEAVDTSFERLNAACTPLIKAIA